MQLDRRRAALSWLCQIVAAAILFQTLFFKFTAAPESVHVFSTLGLEPWGRIASGVAELVACVLLLVPRTAALGALLALGVIGGAIASHLTRLGIVVQDDGGLLFALALVVFASSASVAWLRRDDLSRLAARRHARRPRVAVRPHARHVVLLAALVLAVAQDATPAGAVEPVWSNWRGLAIAGYDPVAYFTDGKAVAGSSELTTEWHGATWRFASAAHREQFVADPERFAPQYGGYCAWAVAQGYTAGIDPEAWRIVGGRLYLNYSKDVQAKWEQDVPGNVARADASWPRLLAGN